MKTFSREGPGKNPKADLLVIGVTTFFLTTSLLFAGIASTSGKKFSRRKRFHGKSAENRRRRRRIKAKQKKKKQERVSTGVAVIALDQDTKKMIVGLRHNNLGPERGGNLWALPGGWLEKGESFECCALRELIEETGLSMKENVQRCCLLNAAPYLNKLKKPVHVPTSSSPKQTTHQKTVEEGEPSVSVESSSDNGSTKKDAEVRYETFYSVTAYVVVLLQPGKKHELELKEKDKCLEWKWVDPTKYLKEISGQGLFPSLDHLLSLSIDVNQLSNSKASQTKTVGSTDA